ncbi:hypothetical protein ABTY53_33150 [Streptomyces noursei]|uniref:hypothetical protein n=1 Tax=Streptomyces noursei TaxID=1971 RepID=UPI0033180435
MNDLTGAALRYGAMRNAVEQIQDSVPGKLEVTRAGIVHDLVSPVGPHELTAARVSRRLEKAMPDGLVATGSGAVFTDIHSTPNGPRYATRKDFVYGEDVTIAEWTISTDKLPRYP